VNEALSTQQGVTLSELICGTSPMQTIMTAMRLCGGTVEQLLIPEAAGRRPGPVSVGGRMM